MENVLREFIERFIRGYPIEKKKSLANNPFANFITNEVPKNIFEIDIIKGEEYRVQGSVGKGAWAAVPWVAIYDKNITTSAQKGEYIVYLLSVYDKILYLTFNQGCTELRKEYSKIETIRKLKENSNFIQEKIESRRFSKENINLLCEGEKNEKAEMYEAGCIFSKAYNIENLPEEFELREDLKNMIDIYKEFVSLKNSISKNKQDKERNSKNMNNSGLNTILYGPPGTGKTYNTVIYAVAICENKNIEDVQSEEYEKVLHRYNELKKEGRIAFTTFHQSFGYEEFIEGIKPIVGDEKKDIGYTIEAGIFKKFCVTAGKKAIIAAKNMPDVSNAKVWCVLLDKRGVSDLKKKCFEEGSIRIGWDKEPETITTDTVGLNEMARRVLLNFQDEMDIGDIIVTQRSNKTIDGIGIVMGDYEYVKEEGLWPRKRKVKWLMIGKEIDITELNAGIKLDRKSVYPLDRISADKILSLVNNPKEVALKTEMKPFVFVIDEINRGNISKIFGELITLIEDTKREGKVEQASAVLPYSGEFFSVPSNVYILGTMNTADRSIALMDTALRRRFQFVEMMPNTDILKNVTVDGVEIAPILEKINERITFLYDREHTIGHAFFIKLIDSPDINTLGSIFEKSIIPLLQEYFYEDYQKIQLVLGDNHKVDVSTKFIKDEEVKVAEIFKGDATDVIDLPEKKYTINKEAFLNIESYKQIL